MDVKQGRARERSVIFDLLCSKRNWGSSKRYVVELKRKTENKKKTLLEEKRDEKGKTRIEPRKV